MPETATKPAGAWTRGRDLPFVVTRSSSFVTLADGRVMAIGVGASDKDACTTRVAIIDPLREVTVDAAPLAEARCRPLAVALNDGGVLVFGGRNREDIPLKSAERWDAAAETWRDAGSAGKASGDQSETVLIALADDRVLVVGDQAPEVWNGTGFEPVSAPRYSQFNPVAILRSDGRVVVGSDGGGLQLWDPSTDSWSTLDAPRRIRWRGENVVAAGGDYYLVRDKSNSRTWRWDVLTNEWTDVGAFLAHFAGGRSVRLAGGRVLSWSSVYDPSIHVATATDTLIEPASYVIALADGRAFAIGYGTHTFSWSPDVSVAAAWRDGFAIPVGGGSQIAFDDRRVLIAGGASADVELTRSLVVDVETGTYSATDSLHDRRYEHGAVRLAEGRVLVAGGRRDRRSRSDWPDTLQFDSVEVWDPASSRWRRAGRMSVPRARMTATLLRDGRVLLVGGATSVHQEDSFGVEGYVDMVLNVVETWDPQDINVERSGKLALPRVGHAAVLLDDGRVAVIGGRTGNGEVTVTTEVWDPRRGTWAAAASMHERRANHTATLLADGRVLVVGGEDRIREIPESSHSTEIWDPTTDLWTVVAAPTLARSGHAAVRLRDGRVLVAGGSAPGARQCDGTAELWNPSSSTWSKAASLPGCIDGLVPVDDRVVALYVPKGDHRFDRRCTAILVPR